MHATFNAQALLSHLLQQEVYQKALSPLKTGILIKITVVGHGSFTLTNTSGGKFDVSCSQNESTDLELTMNEETLKSLGQEIPTSVGDLGVQHLKLLSSPDPSLFIKVELEVGVLTLIRHGYFGIIPLGGPKVASFLASKGLTNLGKIKTTMSNLRRKKK